jgi:hypothetical protein
MPDALVKLYDLPKAEPYLAPLIELGVEIRRALAPEKQIVADWVELEFGRTNWKSECEVAFSRSPVSCFVALSSGQLAGFYCYDATLKGFAGPAGVAREKRRQGIFRGLTIVALQAMAAAGYGYAILGSVNEDSLAAARTIVSAETISGSAPGVYAGMLKG